MTGHEGRRATRGDRPPRVRWYHVSIPLIGVLLLLGLWNLAQQPHAIRRDPSGWSRDTGEYAGAEACRACHASIVERQLASNHAKTVRDLSREVPLAPFGTGQPVIDPLTGARYTMDRREGHPQITLAMGDAQASEKLAFEFGSGAHAHGYLARIDRGQWIDARLNYYTRIQGWDFTSSQDKPNKYLTSQPLGRPQTEAQAAECFVCHSTVVRAQGKGAEPDGTQLRLRPDRSVLGVTCEACHGPRQAHVRERTAGPVTAPAARLSADEINVMCGRCHGLDDVNPAHPTIARFQPRGLDRSRCFRASGGRLSCMTCHDPHTNAEHRVEFYEAKCLSCHTKGSPTGETVCPVNQVTGCVKCHMPEDSHSMPHITFTDHRIRIPEGRDQEDRQQRAGMTGGHSLAFAPVTYSKTSLPGSRQPQARR